ncbi:MAG: hypothetical protein LUE08_08440 [Akkermansiaceae bacterium]|nr:hypothetical protein [Akkermansiaceae bacterium]
MPSMPGSSRKRKQRPPVEYGDWRVAVPPGTEHRRFPSLRETLARSRCRARLASQSDSWEDGVIECGALRGWPRFFRLAAGILVLLPLALLLCMALLRQLSGFHVEKEFWVSDPVWFSLLGGALCVVLMFGHVVDAFGAYVYVLGHELTHYLAVWCSLGRVKGFSVTMEGGYVETTKNNLFIALSPYFVPLWAILWVALLCLLRLFWEFAAFDAWLYGGAAFWGAFHLYWTTWIIPREQPDLEENGMFFSLMIVYIMNMLLMAFVLWCFHLLSWDSLLEDFLYVCRESWEMLSLLADKIAQWTAE